MITCSLTADQLGESWWPSRYQSKQELQFDELSADHLGERRIEDNILLLGKLDIKGALN